MLLHLSLSGAHSEFGQEKQVRDAHLLGAQALSRHLLGVISSLRET